MPLEIPPDDHKLQYTYWLWFSKRSPGKQYSQSYDQNLKLVGRFGSVEQFWAIYSHLVRPSEFQSHCDFHLFKSGIKPMWEVNIDYLYYFIGQWCIGLKLSFMYKRSPVWFQTEKKMDDSGWPFVIGLMRISEIFMEKPVLVYSETTLT